jgi:isoleucyl-tRNA synthetase
LFCSIDGFKEQALKSIKEVRWIPAWGEARIENMVRDRSDWCISRQRKWGVPIPIFYCEDCNEPLINQTTIERIARVFEKEGSGSWYRLTPEEIIGDAAVCPRCGSNKLRAEQDIMDVWFDSGSSYAYVLDEFPDHHFPAEVYLEGNDQYRGWFQSSLLTSVATRGVAPYRTVITHGMVVDGEGKKMSKSLGNGVEPQDVIKNYGADVLRLWVSSVEYTSDVRISKEILKQLSEIYRKIRNTLRILLANLGSPDNDFDPNRDMLAVEKLEDIDKWAVARLNRLVAKARAAYDNYQFHMIYHEIHNYCSIDLSKLYIDITKDRLYCERKNDKKRRSAQTAMYLIAHSLIRLLAPILSFTAEESWSFISHLDSDNADSVFYNEMPEFNEALRFDQAEQRYNSLFEHRDDVMKALEIARENKKIGKSLEAKVCIYGEKDSETMKLFERDKALLESIFIVSQVELSYEEPTDEAFGDTESGISVGVSQADGEKCVRCWTYRQDTAGDQSGQPVCERCRKVVC